MREVYIISTGRILNGKTAGSHRILNLARSLAAGRITVFLCSFLEFNGEPATMSEMQPGVFTLECKNHDIKQGGTIWQFLKAVNYYASRGSSEKIIYLYPTTLILKDFLYLLYFKYIKGFRFFCEINELRRAIAFSSQPPVQLGLKIKYYLKSIKDFILFSLNECQVSFYDGITVISTNLENYFFRRTKKILRVPILCDVEGNVDESITPSFDGKTFKICFAGYIKCDKEGFALLYEALSFVNTKRKVELYLYGILDEEDGIRLRQLAEKYELRDNVFYLGNIEAEKLKYEFPKYHLLILPRPLNRRTKYGFSTKLSDYLISGLPVLVTDVSDNALYIKDNFNGYLIRPGSSTAISEKLIYIIDNYNGHVREIVNNAHKTVREYFDLRLFTEVLTDFFFEDKRERTRSV